ncbi:MAG: isochorismate synthase, partial [Bacteroidota bacterium]
LDNGIAFASYRIPNASEHITLLQWKQLPPQITDLKLLKNQPGFVFAPFDFESGYPIRIIQPDLLIHGETFQEPVSRSHEEEDVFTRRVFIPYYQRENTVIEKKDFTARVESVKKQIKKGEVQKVVLSRVFRERRDPSFESAAFFERLCNAYPDAFVFCVYIPDTGVWFGASPEPLLLVKEKTVTTVSLAGTRHNIPDNHFKPWGEKEKDEQNIVSEYIEDLLKKHNIRYFDRSGPKTFVAGMVEHLKTSFRFPQESLEGNLSEFADQLHPTPSVCGLPKDKALAIIRQTEKHRREYYSGFLGPVNMNGQWDLYVNLRSMKATPHHLEYFIGAGITAGSDAQLEWEETNSKMRTLKSIVESLKES